MAKQQTEDELNLKRKARRRLIGAVVLTLAVVVILPMVLDNEPKPSGKDIDLSIPAPDKVGEFVAHRPVSEVAVTLPAEASGVMASPAPVVANSPVDTPALAPQANVAANPPQQAAPSPHKSAESQKSAQTPQSTETHKSAEMASVDQGSAESYVAQVGAYSKQDAAKQELSKLKKWGFKAYIEKAGDKIRVRVGPYADRAKAEKAAHQLEKHGLHPVIITAK